MSSYRTRKAYPLRRHSVLTQVTDVKRRQELLIPTSIDRQRLGSLTEGYRPTQKHQVFKTDSGCFDFGPPDLRSCWKSTYTRVVELF